MDTVKELDVIIALGTTAQFSQALGEALGKNVPAVIEIFTEKEQISVSSTIVHIRIQSKK